MDLSDTQTRMTTRTYPGRYDNLAEIAAFVRQEANLAGLSFKDVFEVETAVDEAVSNIIEHAYAGEGIGDVTVTCLPEPDGIRIILEDHGIPFDPACVPLPDTHARLKNRKEHGLGYFFLCQLMDEVKFEFEKNVNRLTLFKNKS